MNNNDSIPAVIYARYSSSRQREESIEGQVRECMEYARRNNFFIIDQYIDRAQSGRTDQRTSFQKMINDSAKGRFEAVIVWKIDRFARNRYDAATYRYKLKKNGVTVISAVEHIPEGPEGIILESVMEGYAEYYSANLAQNVKRGMHESALECKSLGNQIYGYNVDPEGKYVINPIEAAIVRRIFEEYAAGERSVDITRRLNEEGYKTKKGSEFRVNLIPKMIVNEKYLGIYKYMDIRIDGGMPAIVSKDLFDKCKARLESNKRAPAQKRRTNFYLTTKAFCGECGGLMVGDSGTSKSGKMHFYYTCTNKKKHKCSKKRVKKEYIEDLIINELAKLIHSDEFIEKIADMVIEYQEQTKDTSVADAFESEIKDVEKKIQNIMKAIEAGIITDSTKKRLVELEEERARKEKQLAKHLMEQPLEFTKDQIVYALYRFRRGDLDSKAYKLQLLETFLQTVYIYDDKIVMTLNYTGDKNKITKNLIDEAVGDPKCSDSPSESSL